MDLSRYSLVYNAAAYFAATEKYPDMGLVDAIGQPGIDGLQALAWALETLSTQGELIRRDMGHDPQQPIRAEKVLLHMKPFEALAARRMVMQAISRGLSGDDENEEVDEVLSELEKKTEAE